MGMKCKSEKHFVDCKLYPVGISHQLNAMVFFGLVDFSE